MPDWQGEQCLEGSSLSHPKIVAKCNSLPLRPALGTVYEVAPAACRIAANASRPDRCGQYASGKFLGPFPLTADGMDATSRCKLRPLSGSARFSADSEGNERLLVDACGFEGRIDRAAALRKLVALAGGKGVLFSGDSMMRQLFLGVIALLRGEETFIADHYFHVDAVYVIATSGHDLLAPIAGNKVSKALAARRVGDVVTVGNAIAGHFAGYSGFASATGTPPSKDVLLAMMFNWETKPSVHRKEFVAMQPNLHVAAFMYWWQNKDPLSDLDSYLATLEAYDAASGNVPSRFVWVTTPWTSPKLFGGVEQSVRVERNDRMLKWITNRPPRAEGRRHGVLDFAAIADSKHMVKTRDGIHYGCILTPKWPDQVTGMKDNGLGCRDPMNRAVVAYFLHAA